MQEIRVGMRGRGRNAGNQFGNKENMGRNAGNQGGNAGNLGGDERIRVRIFV